MRFQLGGRRSATVEISQRSGGRDQFCDRACALSIGDRRQSGNARWEPDTSYSRFPNSGMGNGASACESVDNGCKVRSPFRRRAMIVQRQRRARLRTRHSRPRWCARQARCARGKTVFGAGRDSSGCVKDPDIRSVPLHPFSARTCVVARREPWLRGAVLPSRLLFQKQNRYLRESSTERRSRSATSARISPSATGVGTHGRTAILGFRGLPPARADQQT